MEATMRQKGLWLLAGICLGVVLPIVFVSTAAQAQTAPALTGQVSSSEEGAMEGVLVSARRDGSNVTVTVVTDPQGRYGFPAAKLEPGRYALSIRAVGYRLDGPKAAEVPAGATAKADLKLSKIKNITSQLSNGEWLMSLPGADKQK